MYPLRLRPVRTLLIVLLALLLSTACDKLPRNGALDGQWQLVRLNHTDVTAQRIYWAVQLDLIQLRSPIVAPSTSVAYSGGVTLRFTHRTDSLWIETGFSWIATAVAICTSALTIRPTSRPLVSTPFRLILPCAIFRTNAW